jgi:RND superfamily putative drug exporter
VNISQIFAVVMLYGAGTDYCLFLVSRYREELSHGREPRRAVARSVGSVGGALAASAGTVICGLGMMGLAEFAKVRSGGPAIAIGIAVALAASLTLAPALLRLLGKAAFWPLGVPQLKPGPKPESGWAWISRKVVTRPILIWTTAALALLPLAFLGFQVRANYRATGELAPTSSSVRGLDAIQRHFTAGETGPITVLLETSSDWTSKEGQDVLSHLSQGFGRLDNVAEVRSLTQPLGTPLNEVPAEMRAGKQAPVFVKNFLNKVVHGVSDQVRATAREFYLATLPDAEGGPPRHVARLDVVLHSDPFEPQSVETLDLLQVWLRTELPRSARNFGPVRTECYGVTVNAHDLAQVSESDRLRINVMVLAGIFLILLLLVRRLWLAGYLLVTVLFSYYATLGATTLFAHWVAGRALGEVDWRVPFFLFTILVAVGEDYNILLISRALHERKRFGARKGMRRALARTGGTITSCGLIMAGTFATLMLAGLNTLVQIGFALAFGVILDTFIVRPFLVPALTYWVWKKEEESAKEGEPTPMAKPRKVRQAV